MRAIIYTRSLLRGGALFRVAAVTKRLYFIKYTSICIKTDTLTVDDILEQIKNDKLFGFLRCDVRVPDELKGEYADFQVK